MQLIEEFMTLLAQKPLLMILLLLVTLAGWEIYRLTTNLAGVIAGCLLGVLAAGLLPLDSLGEAAAAVFYAMVVIAGLLAGWFLLRKVRRAAVFISALIITYLGLTLYYSPAGAGFSVSELNFREFLRTSFDVKILLFSLAVSALMVFLEKVFIILFSSTIGAWMLSSELGEGGHFFLLLTVGLAAQIIMEYSRSRREGVSLLGRGRPSGGKGD
jgi:hypothetical protein